MLPVCVPSWVIPGNVAENAAFLRGRVRSVMLCAFEHAPRLPTVLPETSCGLSWHVHLPVDLPWESGGQAAGLAACRVMEQARHLCDEATMAVLHPPRPDARPGLEAFLRVWEAYGLDRRSLLLENLPETDLEALITLTRAAHIGVCLDVAHLALSGKLAHAPAKRDMLDAVRMIHWSAPRGGRDVHAPLTGHDDNGLRLCRLWAERLPHALDVIEVFDWQGVSASWELLRDWRNIP